ncbi:UNVERIFIED_CONTAM: hypothetical protein HDU68_012839 [Siphonaria sp. JEL0065]|nr:hypothetical protein HDU68_012839 [Siphonaria sp. JEL0065]
MFFVATASLTAVAMVYRCLISSENKTLNGMQSSKAPVEVKKLFLFPDGQIATFSRGKTYYRLLGPNDGKRIALICGIGFCWAAMPQVAESFAARGFRVLALDLYGRGNSDAPGGKYDHKLYSTQLVELMDHIGWPRANILGYSMGGGIATFFADTYPERVDNLVLLAPAGLMELPPEGKLVCLPILGDIFVHLAGRAVLLNGAKKELSESKFANAPHMEHTRKTIEAHFRYSPGILRSFLSSIRYGPLRGGRPVFERVATNFGDRVFCIWAAASNRIIGYHESWYFYDHGDKPLTFTADMIKSYTHLNYAFATIHYHSKTDQFYVGFTDSWADYQACVGTNCPTECIPVPAGKQCKGGKVSMVPYIGAPGTCPDTTCYNPSGAPGAPRKPQCEAVLDHSDNGAPRDSKGNPVICGNYAYVLNKVKKQAPGIKYLISIGGWYDSNLFSAATEPKYIEKFVKSVVKFVEFFGFDGVDFDWEYPGWEHGGQAPFKGSAKGAGDAEEMTDCSKTTCAYANRKNDMAKFNAMVTKVRAGLKALGKTKSGSDYLISMAAPAGVDKMNKLDIKTICSQLDFINIMTYDIHGEWDSNTNHQAPLYDNTPSKLKPTNGVPVTSVDVAVNYWIKNGCPANKVVVGVPFYAHAWKAADGGSHGLFQPGTASPVTKLNYVDLAADSYIVNYYDDKAKASYGYSSAQGIFYSYDTSKAISAKVDYASKKGLGGFMVWPIAGDDAKGTLLKALKTPPKKAPTTTKKAATTKKPITTKA